MFLMSVGMDITNKQIIVETDDASKLSLPTCELLPKIEEFR